MSQTRRQQAIDNATDGTVQEYEPPAEPRPSRTGARVVIDFEGRIDGEEFKGGKAEDVPLVLPAGMPPAVTKKLNDEINKAIGTPELQKRLSGEALDVMPMTPEQFGQFMQADIAKWAKLAKERNISLDN